MPSHWTYNGDWNSDSDLDQGDIVLPTDGLSSLFAEVHPHFCDRKYVGYIVLTQSCDLVKRRGNCAARYINLGVIRQLDSVVCDLLGAVCKTVASGVYLTESRAEGRKLLGRLFNQNEQSLGLFYLHPDAEVGIGKPSVALLRIGVALRAEHYNLLQGARSGRLQPEFRNKLGWLVGNIYSRIGTVDWSEQPGGKETIRALTDRLLDEHARWVSTEARDAAVRARVMFDDLEPEEVATRIAGYQPVSPKEQALECVARVVKAVLSERDEELTNRLVNRLRNDQSFSQSFRRS